eukprot:1189336-Prorocentrum_minimum.AAC.1
MLQRPCRALASERLPVTATGVCNSTHVDHCRLSVDAEVYSFGLHRLSMTPLLDPLRIDPLRIDPLRNDPLRNDPLRIDPLARPPADPLRIDPLPIDPLARPPADPLQINPLARPPADPLAGPPRWTPLRPGGDKAGGAEEPVPGAAGVARGLQEPGRGAGAGRPASGGAPSPGARPKKVRDPLPDPHSPSPYHRTTVPLYHCI